MRTSFTGTLAQIALLSAARTNGTAAGPAIDLGVFSNNFRDALFVVSTATITDGTHAITVEESDASGSGFAPIDPSRILGVLPNIGAPDDNAVFSFGCRPTKRYIRLVATTAGSTTGGIFSAVAILGNGSSNPVNRA